MAVTILAGARHALARVPIEKQEQMYAEHGRTTGRRSTNGGTLRFSRHYVTRADGVVQIVNILSGQRGASPSYFVFAESERPAIVNYLRSLR